MLDNIFREYDIRGIVGTELIIEECYHLGQAIVSFLASKHPTSKTIIVGRDGRLHSTAIYEQITRAITDLGFDVIDVGVCPTPVVYFAVQHLGIETALMITASHNPGEYNGIKIWGVAGSQIATIGKMFKEKNIIKPISPAPGMITSSSMLEAYIEYLASLFPHLQNIQVNALIDCGNGAGGIAMQPLIKRMGWQGATLLFGDVDGTFPNHEPDPTVAEHMHVMANELANNPSYAVGIGLDGDCDRMDPMTKEGLVVPGDHLLALFAGDVAKTNPGATVVCDIKSSGSLIDVLNALGAQACVAPSGHSHIKQSMKENKALLAGELSCHFFFHDRYFGYDDGIYAALRLIELLHTSKRTLTQLLSAIPQKVSSPEIRIACKSDGDKQGIVDNIKKVFATRTDLELITIDGIRAHMSYGWGLVRASNTQPVICLRFESDSMAGLDRVKNDFYQLLLPYFDEQLLRSKIELT
jgi:phosphomannomutase/phosphoglucomutase